MNMAPSQESQANILHPPNDDISSNGNIYSWAGAFNNPQLRQASNQPLQLLVEIPGTEHDFQIRQKDAEIEKLKQENKDLLCQTSFRDGVIETLKSQLESKTLET